MNLRLLYPGDIANLPGDWRKTAVAALLAIDRNPEEPRGVRHTILEYQEMMRGDLSGYHSVSFGSATDYNASFRIVYRIADDGIAEVVAIGNRQGSEVFKLAVSRLYPKPAVRRMRR